MIFSVDASLFDNYVERNRHEAVVLTIGIYM